MKFLFVTCLVATLGLCDSLKAAVGGGGGGGGSSGISSNTAYTISLGLINQTIATNFTLHRVTDEYTTISNRLWAGNSNWVHYFEGGTYGCVSTYNGDNSFQGTFRMTNAFNVKLVGLGNAVFLVTNSMSPTGAVSSQLLTEPIFPGNVFAFQNINGLELRDISVIYQRTNYHGLCHNMPGDAIFVGGYWVGDYRFRNVTVANAPNQGIQVQTASVSDYYGTRAWTNGLFENCIFRKCGSTNYQGGTNGILNPNLGGSGSRIDGTAIYVHKYTKVTGCWFDENARDIEWQGDATNHATIPTVYTGIISGNRFVNWMDISVNMYSPSNTLNNIISGNTWSHTNNNWAASWYNGIYGAGANLHVSDNIFHGGFVACSIGLTAASIPGSIVFQNNLCVSNISTFKQIYYATPGASRHHSIYVTGNKIISPRYNSITSDSAKNLVVKDNYIENGNSASISGVDVEFGTSGFACVMSNIVFTGNTIIKNGGGTRSAPVRITAQVSNVNVICFGNTINDTAANSVSGFINDEFAPAATLTNRPTAASQMYTNNIAEKSINATFVMGTNSAASVLVWERDFAAATFTLKKYGPICNLGFGAANWVPVSIYLPPRAVFTISNETSLGSGGFCVTNWTIINK